MKTYLPTQVGLAALALANIAPITQSHAAAFAAEVIDYTPGTGATLTDPSAALGVPYPVVGEGTGFDGPLSPFNPHYESDQVVQIGEGGQLTLRLSHFAEVSAGVREIGIFANTGLIDVDFPNGMTGDPVATFGIDSAIIEFSEDGVSWLGTDTVLLDQPTAYYTDTGNLNPANFGQSHDNVLADYAAQDLGGILTLLGGSAGGTWLELDPLPLTRVGYVRFSLADDGDPGTSLTAEIDAVAIEDRVLGDAIPEPSVPLLVLLVAGIGLRRRRA